MNIVAWILQVFLAVVFLLHGFLYAFAPQVLYTYIRSRGRAVPEFPRWFVIFVGLAELLAGVGLIGPAATHILPWLTPLAALGLVAIMAGATGIHVERKERDSVMVTGILMFLALAVTVLRWQVIPIT